MRIPAWLRSALIVVAVVGASTGVLALIVRAVDPSYDAALQFADEGGVTAVLSFGFLALAAAVAASTFFLALRKRQQGSFVWLLTAAGLAFLALDEVLEFHEKFGRYLQDDVLGKATVFRNWNDALIIGYGVVAAGIGLACLPEIRRRSGVLTLFAIAFAFFAVHTTLDAVVLIPNAGNFVLEESAKVLCTLFLLAGVLVARYRVSSA